MLTKQNIIDVRYNILHLKLHNNDKINRVKQFPASKAHYLHSSENIFRLVTANILKYNLIPGTCMVNLIIMLL